MEELAWNSSDLGAACDPRSVSMEYGIACGGIGKFLATRVWRLSCLMMVGADQVPIHHLGIFLDDAEALAGQFLK
jgi:hypothetical protein